MLKTVLRVVTPALLVAVMACGSAGAGPPGPAPSAPPGMVAVAEGGVQVFVPASWPRNALHCGTPARDTVVVNPGPITACLVTPAPPVSYAWIRTSSDLSVDPDAALARQAATLPGHRARRGEDQLPDGRTRDVLVVDDLKVVVVAVSSDPSLARGIVGSAVAARRA